MEVVDICGANYFVNFYIITYIQTLLCVLSTLEHFTEVRSALFGNGNYNCITMFVRFYVSRSADYSP